MKVTRTRVSRVVWLLALAAVSAAPVVAQDVIPRGADLWKTPGGGFTYTNFAYEPIPADFFCPGSRPFRGKIELKGKPLGGGLGDSDTIVNRLDEAAFDGSGIARTRIQLLALSLVGTHPLWTECGWYDVAVRLDGEQPTTEMKIVRTTPNGGRYEAPLALNVRMVFIPIKGNTNRMAAITHRIDLGPGENAFWSKGSPRYQGRPRVDADGDGRPETVLPRASGFLPGIALAVATP